MNIWRIAVGVALVVMGVVILSNRERWSRWSQKHLGQNVGKLGQVLAGWGKPSDMTVPGVGMILIGMVTASLGATQP